MAVPRRSPGGMDRQLPSKSTPLFLTLLTQLPDFSALAPDRALDRTPTAEGLDKNG